MKNTIYTIETAPEKSRPLLEKAKKKMGMIPNILGGIAVAPAALQAYLGLSTALSQTTLSPTEQQIIALAISYVNDCAYCIAAHTTMALNARVDRTILDELRAGKPLSDKKLESLRNFAVRMQDTRGHLDAGELDAFLAAGYTEEQAYEVIVGIALKTITNLSNRLLNTPLDAAFAANRWEKPACENSCTC